MGSKPRRFPRKHTGSSYSPIVSSEQFYSSRFFGSSFFKQFSHFSSSPEAGLVSIPVSYVGSEQHLLTVSREGVIDLSSLIPGILNVLADSSLSQNVPLPGEWEICPAD